MAMKYDEQDLVAIRATGLLKNDAANDESVFFAEELNHVKAKTYDQKVPPNNAMQVFPVNMDTDPGADTVSYDGYSDVGMAKIIANYADDLPRADVKGERQTVKVYAIGTSYGYSTKDIRRAKMAGKPLTSQRAAAARRANDAKINAVAFKGDPEYGIKGICDVPNITAYVPASVAKGEGTSTKWADKTADQILADLNGVVNAIVDSTNGVELPDTILLPIAQYNYISTLKVPDSEGKTVLSFFLANSPYIKNIKPIHELKGLGTGGVDVGICYRYDPEALELNLPLGYTQYAPQQKNLEFVVPCESSCAGVIVFYPLSVAKFEGI